jgi:hypothetical protein
MAASTSSRSRTFHLMLTVIITELISRVRTLLQTGLAKLEQEPSNSLGWLRAHFGPSSGRLESVFKRLSLGAVPSEIQNA